MCIKFLVMSMGIVVRNSFPELICVGSHLLYSWIRGNLQFLKLAGAEMHFVVDFPCHCSLAGIIE